MITKQNLIKFKNVNFFKPYRSCTYNIRLSHFFVEHWGRYVGEFRVDFGYFYHFWNYAEISVLFPSDFPYLRKIRFWENLHLSRPRPIFWETTRLHFRTRISTFEKFPYTSRTRHPLFTAHADTSRLLTTVNDGYVTGTDSVSVLRSMGGTLKYWTPLNLTWSTQVKRFTPRQLKLMLKNSKVHPPKKIISGRSAGSMFPKTLT